MLNISIIIVFSIKYNPYHSKSFKYKSFVNEACNTLSPYYFIRFYNMKRSIRSERVKLGTILQPLKFCMFPFLKRNKV